MPDPHAIAVLLLTVVALYLFSRDKIPLETSCLYVLVLLTVGFQLFPYTDPSGDTLSTAEFFHGFGHEALVAVCALMIMGQTLVRTGALEPVARFLTRLWRRLPKLALLVTMLLAGALSAVINNTPIVVLLLPILVNVSLRTDTSSAETLMPVNHATIMGGMSTTIGTSTNLLVVAVAEDMGMRRFDMFDFALLAAIAGFIGVLYLWLIAPRLMPERKPPLGDTSPRLFSAQIRIPEGSFADGKTLAEVVDKTGGAMRVERIQRSDLLALSTLPDVVLQAGDSLLVNDTPENLREFEQAVGGELWSGEYQVDEGHPLTAENQQIAEVVIMAGSRLQSVALGDARLRSRYKLTLLAIHRGGEVARAHQPGSLRDIVLQTGDVMLVQGDRDGLAAVKRGGEMLVLDGTADVPHTTKAPLALSIMAAVVVVAALGIFPIAVSAVAGCAVLLLTGCLEWRDATRALSRQVVLIVAVSLALGVALMETGAADYVAQLFVAAAFDMPASVVLSGLILIMAALTNVVSNNAAAVVGTPIAISIAQQLGMPLEPFVLAVLFGANLSFATPMAYKTNILVMNAGGYKFNDFVRVGLPLIAILWLVYSVLLSYAYQLHG